MAIHPTAQVHADAKIGEDVEIGANTVIGQYVEIGDGTRVGPNCTILGHTVIGRNNAVVANTVLGTPPQDLSYRGEPTRLIIGDDNTFREFVSVNVGTAKGDGVTTIGSRCLFMACSHVAHDCIIGNNVIMVNNALLGGHCKVEDRAIINGAAAVTQFTTVGAVAYIGGLTRVVQDVPPFMITEGHPAKVRGVNIIGMKRNGYSEEAINAVKEAHRLIFRTSSALSVNKGFEELAARYGSIPEVLYLIDFLQNKQKGKNGRAREALRKAH
jgi:UDP-N-acetylglucosamine acyltransferase